MQLPVLAIIVPCFNEEDCILYAVERLSSIIHELVNENIISKQSFLFFIDDGSNDNTWNIIAASNANNKELIKGIKFSRNFGNQKAILAGLIESVKYNADCVITIDADLQQDETKIAEFIEKYNNGAQIVCGIRNNRKTDGLFKRTTALAFYKIMNMLGVSIKINHSDYRLVSKKAINSLSSFKETNLFLRGIFNELGYKKDFVYFDVKPRKKGVSKYTPFSLFSLAISGITSFSIVPLHFVSALGLIMSCFSFLIGISAIVDKLIRHNAIPGWTTIVVTVGLIGGIQIFCLGIIGEYIGQLFQEVKARPRYIIENIVD